MSVRLPRKTTITFRQRLSRYTFKEMCSNVLHHSTRASILTLNRDVPMTTICLYGCLSLLTKQWGSVFKCSRRGMVKNYRTKERVVLPAQGRVLSCVLKNEEFTRQWKQWWWALSGRVGLRSGHHEGISSRKSPTKPRGIKCNELHSQSWPLTRWILITFPGSRPSDSSSLSSWLSLIIWRCRYWTAITSFLLMEIH